MKGDFDNKDPGKLVQQSLGKLNMSPDKMPYGSLMVLLHKNIPYTGYPITVTHVSGIFWGTMGIWAAAGAFGASLIVNTLAVIFPALMSYRCEKEKTPPTQWLSYWIIYSSFFILEFSPGLSSSVPFYHLIKLVLLLWCMYPGAGNGAEVVYNIAIRPVFSVLDKNMKEAGRTKKNSASFSGGASLDRERKRTSSKDDTLKKSGSKDSLKHGKFK